MQIWPRTTFRRKKPTLALAGKSSSRRLRQLWRGSAGHRGRSWPNPSTDHHPSIVGSELHCAWCRSGYAPSPHHLTPSVRYVCPGTTAIPRTTGSATSPSGTMGHPFALIRPPPSVVFVWPTSLSVSSCRLLRRLGTRLRSVPPSAATIGNWREGSGLVRSWRCRSAC